MQGPDLRALARRPERLVAEDLTRLHQLSRELRAAGAPDLAACLDAALRLFIAASIPARRLDRRRLLGLARGLLEMLATPVARFDPSAAAGRNGASPGPSPNSAVPDGAAAIPARALGSLLIELGHVTQPQIDAALELQTAKGLPIGECLLLQGCTSPERLLEALRLQERLREEDRDPAAAARAAAGVLEKTAAEAPAPSAPRGYRVTEDMFFGEVLLGMEAITNQQLEQAMHMHHHRGIRVGQALIELGALSEQDLEHALDFQRSLRRIARLANSGRMDGGNGKR